MRVSLERAAYLTGENVKISVEAEGVENFEQIQIEVFRVGVNDPSLQLSFAKAPNRDVSGVHQESFSTGGFPFGFYEIKLIRFSTFKEGLESPSVDFRPERDFGRLLFEVSPPFAMLKTKQGVEMALAEIEARLRDGFAAPRYVIGVRREEAKAFSVFVFVKKLLIGRRYRLDRFELVPAPKGVSDQGAIAAVKAFLQQNTEIGLTLTAGADELSQSQQDDPVCVAHFPNVVANSKEEAQAHCYSVADTAVLSLGLMRGSSGRIFASVVKSLDGGEATLFTSRSGYYGNLITGEVAGEVTEVLTRYQKRIETDPMARLLLDLYREAQNEQVQDFQYFKYWQVLEVMAEEIPSPMNEDFNDENGEPVADVEQRKSTGSAARVYHLLRIAQHGSAKEAWENANKWFALRTAVGHKGAISQYEQLARASVRSWARNALNENANAGYAKVLTDLRSATEHVLKWKLLDGN